MTQSDPPPSAWQVSQLLAQVIAKLDVLIAQGTDHETRIRMLEKNRWPLASVAVLVPIAALAVAILVAVYGPAK